MLNISLNSTTRNKIPSDDFASLEANHLSKSHRVMARWIIGIMVVTFCFLFLPWTQNIQAKGKLTTLYPQQRPQTIQSNIDGRIEKWYVYEGQAVQKGDTIAHISEIKTQYTDPNLVERTRDQIRAKKTSANAYAGKALALDEQIAALIQERDNKIQQLKNKIKQTRLKIISDSIKIEQAKVDIAIAKRQLNRTIELEKKGIKSLADVEDKRTKYQSTVTKITEAENKLDISKNELDINKTQLSATFAEYNQKIAKVRSDRFSAVSAQSEAVATVRKLEVDASNYELRRSFHYIRASQDGYIVKTLKAGIGETVKAGTEIATIIPLDYKLAVELFIQPMDLPLIRKGQEVRFIFDGWPAFIFSGWPSQSFGTYSGKIFAIDRVISPNNKYRIIVEADESEKPWPKELQVGSGAQGIALLNNVPLWYELWRQLNGFPPDFYENDQTESPKLKAPVRSVK